MDDISCVFEGVAGIGGIYISNLKAAQNVTLLTNLGIRAIVTAVRGGQVQHDKSDITDHLYVPADDVESYDLSKHFQQTYLFIDNARRKTNVLVHCYAGISRSATIVIAYLLRKYNYSLEKVISMVKRRRSIINPNKGFIQQLKKEASKMGITTNQNEQPVQELLRRNTRSVQKKRSISSYIMKRITKQCQSPQKVGRISLMDPYNMQNKKENEKISSTLGIQSKILQKEQAKKESETNCSSRPNLVPSQNSTNFSSIKLNKLDKMDEQINKQKQKSFASLTTKQMTNSVLIEKYEVDRWKPQIQTNKNQSVISQKLQKIEKLKSKVIQQEKRRRSATPRRHQSQLHEKYIECINDYNKISIVVPQSILSFKLSNLPNKNHKSTKQRTVITKKVTFQESSIKI